MAETNELKIKKLLRNCTDLELAMVRSVLLSGSKSLKEDESGAMTGFIAKHCIDDFANKVQAFLGFEKQE